MYGKSAVYYALSDCNVLVNVYVCLFVCTSMYVLPLECIRKTKAATNGKQNVAYSEAFAEACHTCKCKCKRQNKYKTQNATHRNRSQRQRQMQSQHQCYIGLQNFVLPFKLGAHLRDRLRAAAAVACHTKWILHGIPPNSAILTVCSVIMLALWQTFCTGTTQLCAESRVAISCAFS